MSEVKVHDLTKTFGRGTAVRAMTFTAQAGKVTRFFGPTGSGKTTWVATVPGPRRPARAPALSGGFPSDRLASPRRSVGAVLEANGFHPGRRARDHLRVLADAAGIPRIRVDEVLGQVGLAGAADRRGRGVSPGRAGGLRPAAAPLGGPPGPLLLRTAHRPPPPRSPLPPRP